jgi:DNA polymerase-3 subunit beta
MKIEFEKKVMESALQKAGRAASTRSPLPILGYVLIKTGEGGSVTFSATDLEFGVEYKLSANVLEEGAVCVPARTISDLVGQIQEDIITIESKGDGPLELTTVRSKYHINVRDVDEFPILPRFTDKPLFSIPQGTLREVLRNVVIAVASIDEQRAALTGVFITANESGLLAVSTDSRRLVKVVEPIDEPPEREFSAIVPQRSVREILSLLGDNEDPVYFSLSEGQVFLSFNQVSVFSRIIDGKFPNYDVVIPRSSDVKVLMDRSRLHNAVKRALIMAFDKDTPDLLRVEISRESIKLMSNSVDLGDAFEEVSVQEMQGEPLEIAVNGKYLMDALSVINDEFVWILLNSPVMPVMLNSSQKDNYVYIVMPVRLKRGKAEDEVSAQAYA